MSDTNEKINGENPEYSMETQLIYGKNVSPKWDYTHHVVPPLSSSVIFRLDSVQRGAEGFMEFGTEQEENHTPIYIYDRLGEPNKDLLEENLCYAEKGECAVTFSTGMGAISAILGILAKSGDEIIANHTMYGCTYSLLTLWYPRYNIVTHQTDLSQTNNLRGLINEKTRVVYFETPSNPNLTLIDIEAVAQIVKEENSKRRESQKISIVVDNTFATPYCQRPIELGADFVIHSLTKGIGGFGTDMGGVVIGPKLFHDKLLLYRKDFGAVLGTKAAWTILTYGLSTLHLRISRQTENAVKVTEFLNAHPKVQFVNYPGLPSFAQYELAQRQMRDFRGNFAPGSLIYFGLKGSTPVEQKANGIKFMNHAASNAYTMTLAVSLGHTRTLIEHPASMTHSMIPPEGLEKSGIHPGGVRIAIGVESVEDILHDLEKCLSILE